MIACRKRNAVAYRGFRICVEQKELVEGGWTADFVVGERLGHERIERPYCTHLACSTQEQAIQMARREIDNMD